MIDIITRCPVCASTLDRVKDQLFCRNLSCDSRLTKSLLHFVKVMKIKGLGEKTIEKLQLNNISQIYDLTVDILSPILGDKISIKIYDEIQKSKSIKLSTYMQAFGIPLIGNSATTKLEKNTKSMWDITSEICSTSGLGKIATSNLLTWIDSNKDNYKDLPIVPIVIEQQDSSQEISFSIAITGKLNDFSSRNKAKELLNNKGIKVVGSVSKNIKYLVCDIDNSTSSSVAKAKTLNIPIITMNNLLNNINGEIND